MNIAPPFLDMKPAGLCQLDHPNPLHWRQFKQSCPPTHATGDERSKVAVRGAILLKEEL